MRGIVTTTVDTYLKPGLWQLANFPIADVCNVKAGEQLQVLDVVPDTGHYLITLTEPRQGKTQWYLFKGHCKFVPDMKLSLDGSLASRVIRAMDALDYQIDTESGQLNIVYVEGMNADGTLNSDRLDEWNDLRLVIGCNDGTPTIKGCWKATTEPGAHYTYKPMNPKGAARIGFGQYKAWRVGVHKDHEALIQSHTITVHRDLNKDGLRTGDAIDKGIFYIDQHWGYDLTTVGRASAGCLVGQSKQGHREFMKLIKTDSRYQANFAYVFTTTVLDGSKI